MRQSAIAPLVLCAALAACGGGGSAPVPAGNGGVPTPTPGPLVQTRAISSDPFSVAPGEHATEVESSAAAFGSTIVSVFQTGRFYTHGASDIGFATSVDAGATWTNGTFSALARAVDPASPFDSVSDPVVAYDAMHGTWIATALAVVVSGPVVPQIDIMHSRDGIAWDAPATLSVANGDKEWIACDNGTSSPYRGHCYLEWDEFGDNDAIHMARSTDGGATWTKASGSPGFGIGGQPLIRPDGTVVVPIDDAGESTVLAFSSHDGGATWSNATTVSSIIDHRVGGNLRAGPLVSAAADASGTLYAAWHDCRFRTACSSNDVVFAKSNDGVQWSAPSRVPVDAVTSTEDHFLPIVAVDGAGSAAHVAIAYYWYPAANCVPQCQLRASAVASLDGGTSWGAPQQLNAPVDLLWIANTDQGFMVGDYNALVFANGRPLAVFANASAPGSLLDEFMAAPVPGAIGLSSTVRRISRDRAIRGARRDPGGRPRP